MTTRRSAASLAFLGALCVIFVLLATANSGGYRYGIGDQAFYEPATQLRLHPELFPRDRALLESQAKLTSVDEVLAAASRLTGLQPPSLFLVIYLASLVTLCIAADKFARVLRFSPWAVAAFLGLLTLRHRIAKTGANTLEGYMHPRQLAFGIGVIALTCSLKDRWWWTLGLIVLASTIHPTTACWFGALIAGGMIFESITREGGKTTLGLLFGAVLAGGALCNWFLTSLPSSVVPASLFMDADWMKVFADKDYIFVSQWPAFAWAFNLAYVPLIWWIFHRREQAGVAHPNEHRLVGGVTTLLAIFAASIFFSEAHFALAVQLQVSRVFWLMDVIIAAYAAWWLTSDPAVARVAGRWAPRLAVAAVAALSIGRGVFTLSEAGADRALFRLAFANDDWTRAAQWLRTQPTDWLVLADPDHAWKHGTSLRVAASRDVVLEAVKDTSISLYDRAIAMRTADRLQTLSHFSTMSADEARAIGRQFGASVLLAEHAQVFALPRLYENAGFTVYDLR